MKISTKDEFRRLSAAGLLGNTFRSFKDWAALEASGYRGWLGVRSRTASDKALFIPEVHYSGIPLGTLRSSAVYFQEVPLPGTYRVANLEAGYMGGVSRPGLHLRYTTGDARNLRHSLDERGKDVHGAQAARVLRELDRRFSC